MLIESFVVLLYDQTSAIVEVNPARKDLFSKKARTLQNFSTTRAALEQHTMRAVVQGAYIWSQVLLKKPVIPSPSDWRWEKMVPPGNPSVRLFLRQRTLAMN